MTGASCQGRRPTAILDALVYWDVASYPGVVIRCRALGVLGLEQEAKTGGRERNDRILALPLVHPRGAGLRTHADLDRRVLEEIEHFFTRRRSSSRRTRASSGGRAPRPRSGSFTEDSVAKPTEIPGLGPDTPMSVAGPLLVRGRLEDVRRQEAALATDGEPDMDAVHDARIATRRLRAAIALSGAAISPRSRTR